MTGDDVYAHETGALRDVANTNMAEIAQVIGEVRSIFGYTSTDALQAFRSRGLGLGSPPFAVAKEKWLQINLGISNGMMKSQARVNDAAEGLRRNAGYYDTAEQNIVASIERLLRYRDER
jgi:hypothetical protein